jgi:transposase
MFELSEEEESELRTVRRTPSASQRQAMRARIVLRGGGASNTQIAAELGVSLPTVGLWRRNFSERCLEGLETAPRTERPREIDDAEVQRVLAMTLETLPDESARWSAPAHGRGEDLRLYGPSDLS